MKQFSIFNFHISNIFRSDSIGFHRRWRAVTLIEMVGAMLVLAFITLGTVQFYRAGDRQQRTARNYSNVQTANREGVRRMVRTLRHAFTVETDGSTAFNGAGANPVSGANQIIVSVPQPNDSAGTGRDHIRFYLSGSTLYAQRSDDTNAGIAIATGVQSLTFAYYKTTNASSGASTATLSSGYSAATEVNVVLVSSSGGSTSGASSTENAYVQLRNTSLGI